MNIREGEVHMWLTYDQDIRDTHLLDEYHTTLNVEESQQQRRFHFEKHRHQYLIARALVRSTLSLYVNAIKPAQWEFDKNRYGKPFVKNAISLPLQFNLSHTEGLIVLGVTLNREIGVDVEWLGRHGQTVEIAERFFSSQEVAQLRALPEACRRDRFFDLWTLKEAYIKACGMGLSIPLDQFTFHFHQDNQFAISFDSRLNDHPHNWIFSKILPNKTHKAALALRDKKCFTQNKHWSISFIETIPLGKITETILPYFPSFAEK